MPDVSAAVLAVLFATFDRPRPRARPELPVASREGACAWPTSGRNAWRASGELRRLAYGDANGVRRGGWSGAGCEIGLADELRHEMIGWLRKSRASPSSSEDEGERLGGREPSGRARRYRDLPRPSSPSIWLSVMLRLQSESPPSVFSLAWLMLLLMLMLLLPLPLLLRPVDTGGLTRTGVNRCGTFRVETDGRRS
jgi:hypothetical protein